MAFLDKFAESSIFFCSPVGAAVLAFRMYAIFFFFLKIYYASDGLSGSETFSFSFFGRGLHFAFVVKFGV